MQDLSYVSFLITDLQLALSYSFTIDISERIFERRNNLLLLYNFYFRRLEKNTISILSKTYKNIICVRFNSIHIFYT